MRVSIVILSSLDFHIEQVDILKVFIGWKDCLVVLAQECCQKLEKAVYIF